MSTIDRRQTRHLETRDEVVATALEIMAESGPGSVSLGEVARRMGIKPPSLYVYFPSKAALYDELFVRGWAGLLLAMGRYTDFVAPGTEPFAVLRDAGAEFVRWSVEHSSEAQLIFWRPVPGWEPSVRAAGAAAGVMDQLQRTLAGLSERGALRPDADLVEAGRVWLVLLAGVIGLHLGNEPADGTRFTSLVEPLTEMFLARYGAV
ncbi:AcrR family transcriptional regulator [Allocatelliglobosispora scoriae]|uniref:AcrR family transcriptional regulator n=1 Tax=Allocatelliglobosispora scoriae TaxID=643052 RepID=A0A841BFG8_9ACTN|nr:TetR/AcrR family transcriptional regulator [Allocatelliglobosispora scoriae]MBB5867034.1 AcrR family transcriptional regulator [Allocatelliglobosispora scoriae]